jgi:hypothetical protein
MKRHSHNKDPRRGGGPAGRTPHRGVRSDDNSSICSKLGNVKLFQQLFQHIPNHVFSSSSAFFASCIHLTHMLGLPKAASAT